MIRPADKKDFDTIRNIMNQVQELHVTWRPDIYKPTEDFITLSYVEEMIEKQALFVAEMDGEVVGAMSIMLRHVESPTQVTRDVIFVDSLAVDEKHRGQGIGHAFFDFLKKRKEEIGADGIELQVNARNEKAYQMYKDYGFTEKSINMELLP